MRCDDQTVRLQSQLNATYAALQSAIAMRHSFTAPSVDAFDDAIARLGLSPFNHSPNRDPTLLGQWWLVALFLGLGLCGAIWPSETWYGNLAIGVNWMLAGIEIGAIWQRRNERIWPSERYQGENRNA